MINNNIKKAILSYSQLEFPGVEFDIEVHHNEPYLMLVVDWSKMDKNSPSFDESYRKKIYKERPENYEGVWISQPLNKIININNEIYKFFNVQLKAAYKFSNYSFLEPIEKKIRKAVTESELPHLEFEFRGDANKPILDACFYKFNSESDKKKYPNLGLFVKDLEEILNNELIIKKNYQTVFSSIKRK